MIGCSLNAVLWPLFFVMNGVALDSEVAFGAHPDHGAPFVEQLSGRWVISSAKGEERRLRMYDDGRVAFMAAEEGTAGSYVILRTDERQKGVLRMEYYLDGNLHLQELRCEIYFEEHARDANGADRDHHHDHGQVQEGDAEEGAEAHHHEYLQVEVLPAAEQRLSMAGHYLHQH